MWNHEQVHSSDELELDGRGSYILYIIWSEDR